MTRQLQRSILRAETWATFSWENALIDEHGIIPRRVRREMAAGMTGRIWREMRRQPAEARNDMQ